ncbi:MAG: nuclear transport factor 2 family protein [Nitrospirae bacterium]|nr:nuclear transport factor 2 family protein [Nitrospirota bacterium]
MPASQLNHLVRLLIRPLTLGLMLAAPLSVTAAEIDSPEMIIRTLVRANAEKDLTTLSRFMAHDADIVCYTIGGRKYVGWEKFLADMKEEFDSVTKLELPIAELKVWTHGDTAWFNMELDYIRYVGIGGNQARSVLPLRETGVLERRNGQWFLLSWHESFRDLGRIAGSGLESSRAIHPAGASSQAFTDASAVDLSGEWEISELVGKEEDKRYKATLYRGGNGPYTQQGGRFATTRYSDRRWEGTWQQPGNDREGGFELLLSEDGMQAEGIWWYSRVGTRTGIPPRAHGGNYLWKRLSEPGSATVTQ